MAKHFCKISLILFLFLISARAFAQDTVKAGPDNSPNTYKVPLLQFKTPHKLEFCGKHVPLERRDVWERLDKQFLFARNREAQVVMWLKRSRKYFPFIEKRLKHYNLPDDLKYLAVAESDLNQYALSPKGAAGPWQFMRPTGRRFGLEKKRGIDERYSYAKATDAALKYLASLYEQFGQWTLAVAAYNCGEKRVEKEIKEQKTDDFFDLYLPKETEEYLLRIMAIKIILSTPEKYGFVLEEEEFYQPYDVEEVVVTSPGLVHIRLLAEAAGTYYRTIKELNPDLKGYYLPEGQYTLFIPRDGAEGFAERWQSSLSKASRGEKSSYRVKQGDSLSKIALKLEISMQDLIEWNNIEKSNLIYPGQTLVYFKPIWK
jgi:hypothetical protein